MKPAANTIKRVSAIAGLSVAGLLSVGAYANDFNDTATVISSIPVYERVSAPRQQCWTEQVASYEERRVNRVVYNDAYNNSYNNSYDNRGEYNRGGSGIGAGTVLGAVIGGVIGHQFGHSSGGRDRGTAVGAILGGIVGNSAENNNRNDGNYRNASAYSSPREVVDVERVPVTRDVQRCRTVADIRDEVRGYDVRYRYHGREYTTRLPYDPGSTLQVDVNVRPVSRRESRYEQRSDPDDARPDSRYESRDELRYPSRNPTPVYSRTY